MYQIVSSYLLTASIIRICSKKYPHHPKWNFVDNDIVGFMYIDMARSASKLEKQTPFPHQCSEQYLKWSARMIKLWKLSCKMCERQYSHINKFQYEFVLILYKMTQYTQ